MSAKATNHEGTLNAETFQYDEINHDATGRRVTEYALVFTPTCSCGWAGQPGILRGPATESLLRHMASKSR